MSARTDAAFPSSPKPAPGREYPRREIFMYGRYIECQILNWEDGPPPKYIICNPLHRDYREVFLAQQGMGTWMRADPLDVARDIARLQKALVDILALTGRNDLPDAWRIAGRAMGRAGTEQARLTGDG